MFKRAFQEKRHFAPEGRANERVIAGAELAANPILFEPAAFVEAVISRLDEIVAEGLGAAAWRADGASAFSI